ncbi:MAG: hypothetical protein NTV34_11275 [Proteobacteria bacterium]|nr:hypothetical protein [Pseudomonadota bacterium]
MSHNFLIWISLIASCVSACGQRMPWEQKKTTGSVVFLPPPPAPETSTASPPPIADSNANEMAALDINHASLTNLPQLIQSIQANRWHDERAHCQNMTIAIFDNGFDGLTESKGLRLPPDLAVEKAPVNEPLATPHGTKLAEVIWGLCTGAVAYSATKPGPTLKLFNTNGYSNLAAAIEAVTTTQPVDIVLYSQVWEFGGNFDGRGFINTLVKRATDKGILWVNAAGNFGQSAWQGPLTFKASGQANLPHQERSVRMSVNAPQTKVKLTLAWNDFTDAKTYRTNQDLDFHLEDANHNEIAVGKLIQDGVDHQKDKAYSWYAREQINTVLNPGIYSLSVTSSRPAAFKPWSRIRIAGDGSGLVFLDQTKDATVMIPADNPEVLTIGASDVDYSSSGLVIGSLKQKPEAVVPSVLQFDNGETFAGSSSAAAVAVGVIALYQGSCGSVPRGDWVKFIESGNLTGLPSQVNTQSPDAPTAKVTLQLPKKKQCFPLMRL